MVDEAIEREVRIAAPPETVFEFFVDPAKHVRWMGRHAELDARPGGIYRIDYGDGDVALGAFVEIERPRRIVHAWGWEAKYYPPPGTSRVEITLEPDGDGTLVRLRHTGLPAEELKGHSEGWDQFLPRLVEAAARGESASPEPPTTESASN